MPMRILQVHNRYRSDQPSGENLVVDQEAGLLRNAGHEVCLYQRQSDSIAEFSAGKRAQMPLRISWSETDRLAILRTIRKFNPEIVHVHNVFPLISPSILVACTALSVPVVATLHNYRLFCASGNLLRDGKPCLVCLDHSPVNGIIHSCYRNSRVATIPLSLSIGIHRKLGTWAKHVGRFIVMSEFARRLFSESGMPSDRIVVKPHFVPDPENTRMGPGKYSLYLGRLSSEKGVDLLIDSWRPEFGPLRIVGDGEERRRLELQAAPLKSTIRFEGMLNRDSAMKTLLQARMVVMPSRCFETFGLAAVEAQAHGVPVVVSDVGVLPETINEGESGLRFKSGNQQSLTDALALVSKPEVSQRMGLAARRHYLNRYAPTNNLKMLESIYDQARQNAS